jgi:hypothetical protein
MYIRCLSLRCIHAGVARQLIALAPLALALGMSSCTNVRNPVPPGALNLKPDEGIIVATFASKSFNRAGEEVSGSGLASVHIKGEGADREAVLMPLVFPDGSNPLGITTGTGSDVVAVVLPAGNYHIRGWTVRDFAVTASVTFSNRLPMNVPLVVQAGKATYAGRIHPVSIYGKNIMGMRVPGAAFVMITDEYAEDAPKISKAYPSISRSSIRRSNVAAEYKKEMKRIAETPENFFGLF